MTNQQIVETLKSKGFDTKVTKSAVVVSLNRPINAMEVNAALGYDIPHEFIASVGNVVVVNGYDD